MARRIVNRKEKRAEHEAYERTAKEDEEQEEEEEEEGDEDAEEDAEKKELKLPARSWRCGPMENFPSRFGKIIQLGSILVAGYLTL